MAGEREGSEALRVFIEEQERELQRVSIAWVEGLGYSFKGVGFRVQVSRFKVKGYEFRG